MNIQSSRLVSVLEHTSDVVVVATADREVFYANHAACKLFGNLLGQHLEQILVRVHPPHSRDLVAQNGVPTALAQGTWQADTLVINIDGQERLVSQLIVAHRDEAGQLAYLATVMRDITEERKTQTELLGSERRFRSLAANVPGAIFRYAIRPNGTDYVEYMSPGCLSIWEVSAEEIKESPSLLWDLVYPDDLQDMKQSVMQSAQTMAEWLHAWRILTPSGRHKWLEGRGQPERLSDGTILWNSLILDVTQQKQAEERIKHLVNNDELTHLLNRHGFESFLDQAQARWERDREPFGLLFIDLDNFKNLNDSLGHLAGDLALAEVAVRLRTLIRAGDVTARLGGDEFVVLITGLDLDELERNAALLATRILSALRLPFRLGERDFSLSASVGIALANDENASGGDILRWADLAMYSAKEDGRDRFRFFDPAIQHRMLERTEIEQELRSAVSQLRSAEATSVLWLAFQPVVDAEGCTRGYEALLRWKRASGTALGPDVFIPIAEHSALILPIGNWVLAEVCRVLASWAHDTRTSTLQIAVNVSSVQLRQPEFVSRLQDLLATSRAPASRLKLELTESVLLQDVEQTIATLALLRELGVEISLDDFGTGYSSLAYLRNLPLQELKIDKAFVRDLANPQGSGEADSTASSDNTVFVSLILKLAEALGLQVVAEGVETPEQFARLRAMGCLRFQGYLFGRPAPLPEIIQATG